MKSKKQLTYGEIQTLVIQQLSKIFQPDLKKIKFCLEKLVEREYLTRDSDQPNLFIYCA